MKKAPVPATLEVSTPVDGPVRALLLLLLGSHLHADTQGGQGADCIFSLSLVLWTGVTEQQLRQLISEGLLQHRVETSNRPRHTIAGSPPPAGWDERSCFCLTASGVALALQLLRGAVLADPRQDPTRPVWVARDRDLWFCGRRVLHFGRRAPNPMRLLDRLEELAWPPRIDNPFETDVDCTAPDRLVDVVKSLHRAQAKRLLTFKADADRTGLRWWPAQGPRKPRRKKTAVTPSVPGALQASRSSISRHKHETTQKTWTQAREACFPL